MSVIINDSTLAAVVNTIFKEMGAGHSRPYPTDHLRRTALVVEEAGEALQAALDVTRHETHAPGHLEHLRHELTQTAAMAIRQLVAMEEENE